MKKQILTICALLAVAGLVGAVVYAAGQYNNDEAIPGNQQQTQANEDIQPQTQGQLQTGEGTDDGNQTQQQTQTSNQGQESQIQTQTQQQLQDGSAGSNQVQNQNQIQNQGEGSQIQTQEQESAQAGSKDGLQTAEQRRSKVANAVQEMLKFAEKNKGMGQQIRTIAQTQAQNQEQLEASLQKVQSRNKFVKFFIGQNYSEISNAEKVLDQNREQIQQLNQIMNQLSNTADQQTLKEQIQTLEQANIEIEKSLNASQKGFSLLGWLFRYFAE